MKVRPTVYPAVIEQPAQPPVKDIVSVKRADNPAELVIIAASVIPYLSADIIFNMNSVFSPAPLRNTGLSRCAAFCQLKAAEIHRNTSFESAGVRNPLGTGGVSLNDLHHSPSGKHRTAPGTFRKEACKRKPQTNSNYIFGNPRL